MGPDVVGGTASAADPHGDTVIVLDERAGGVTESQLDPGQAPDVGPQDVLHHWLRYLLAGLREAIVPRGRQAERVVEVGDPTAGEGFAEGDPLRPGHRQRRGGPQGIRDTPPSQVFHRPHTRRLGPWAQV